MGAVEELRRRESNDEVGGVPGGSKSVEMSISAGVRAIGRQALSVCREDITFLWLRSV